MLAILLKKPRIPPNSFSASSVTAQTGQEPSDLCAISSRWPSWLSSTVRRKLLGASIAEQSGRISSSANGYVLIASGFSVFCFLCVVECVCNGSPRFDSGRLRGETPTLSFDFGYHGRDVPRYVVWHDSEIYISRRIIGEGGRDTQQNRRAHKEKKNRTFRLTRKAERISRCWRSRWHADVPC